MPALPKQEFEQLVDGGQPPFVVEPVEVRIVAEAAADLWRSESGLERLLARGVAKELRQLLVPRAPGLNSGPIGNQPAKHRWAPTRHDLRVEPGAVDVPIFGDRLHES